MRRRKSEGRGEQGRDTWQRQGPVPDDWTVNYISGPHQANHLSAISGIMRIYSGRSEKKNLFN